jgi:hypothetical protein
VSEGSWARGILFEIGKVGLKKNSAKRTRGRFGSSSGSAVADSITSGFDVGIEPFKVLETTFLVFEMAEDGIGIVVQRSLRLVMVLELSDLESSIARGRAGGIILCYVWGVQLEAIYGIVSNIISSSFHVLKTMTQAVVREAVQ